MGLTVLVDDLRNIEAADVILRTYYAAVTTLVYSDFLIWDQVDVLLMDHDLGDPAPNRTGYDVLCELESATRSDEGGFHCIRNVELITSNPVGRDRMACLLRANSFVESKPGFFRNLHL
jgi:hypothetical protein